MKPEYISGSLLLVSGVFIVINIYALLKDKQVKGVRPYAVMWNTFSNIFMIWTLIDGGLYYIASVLSLVIILNTINFSLMSFYIWFPGGWHGRENQTPRDAQR